MSRKDFEAIARAVLLTRNGLTESFADARARAVLAEVADRLATACAQTNGMFDRGRFMRACGFEA